MLSRSLATIAVVVVILIVIVGGPKLGRVGIQPATPIAINGDIGMRVAALETRVASLESHLGTPQGSPVQDASPAPSPGSTPVGGTGDAQLVTLGTWKVVVRGAEVANRLDLYSYGEPRGKFVLVHLTVVNLGQGPARFPFESLVLATGERKDPLAELTTLSYMSQYSGGVGMYDDLNPGVTYEAVSAVFDVPVDSAGFILTSATEPFTVDLGI